MDPWAVMVALGTLFALCRLLLWLIPVPIPLLDVDVEDVMVRGNQASEDSYIYIPGKGKGTPDKVHCYDPSTMKYLGFYPVATPDEVWEHVKQAREAQIEWAKSSFAQRRHLLRILLRYILDHQELICQVSARDSGKTMADAVLGEILTTVEKIRFLLKEGESWLKPERRSVSPMMFYKSGRVEYQPLGVMGAIVPWNYPFHNMFNPLLPALFAGNAIVIKVSEHSSWSSFFYLRIIHAALVAAGAPQDLVHVITGFAETGESLVSSVDKILFIGSTAIGRKVMERASKTLTPVVLELGGKDCLIICEDANVKQIAQTGVRACFMNSGQNCAGAERFYVHKAVHDQFVKEAVKIVKSIRVGAPLEGHCDMGSICLPEHTERLHILVNDALEKGAEIAGRGEIFLSDFGGDVVGQFFPPTILVNVNHSMRIVKEEIFGPILCVMKFGSDEEVVNLANDSDFGLGCAVFSGNKIRAKAIASKICAGFASINDFGTTYMCQALPFGGTKHSGFGRFGGPEGLRSCCLVKAVLEDRWLFIKTTVPKPLQYPVAENAFKFEEALARVFYGMSWDTRLSALFDVLKNLAPPSQEFPVFDSKVE